MEHLLNKPGPEVIELLMLNSFEHEIMLNSIEHEIYPVHKC